MAEEFLESEVIFSNRSYNFPTDEIVFSKANHKSFHNNHGKSRGKKRNKKKCCTSSSAPINIIRAENVFVCGDSDEFEEEYDEGEMVPPHVILGRRVGAEKMAFSMCTGNGRTLKGRDLSQVRNSILRMTGFLEDDDLSSIVLWLEIRI